MDCRQGVVPYLSNEDFYEKPCMRSDITKQFSLKKKRGNFGIHTHTHTHTLRRRFVFWIAPMH